MEIRGQHREQVLSSHQAGFWDRPGLPGLTARALLAWSRHLPCLLFLKPHPRIQYAISQVSFDSVPSGLCVLRSGWEAAWFLGSLCARGQKTSLNDKESQINSMYPELTLTPNVLPFHQVPLMPGRNRTRQGLHSTQGHVMAPLASLPSLLSTFPVATPDWNKLRAQTVLGT